MSSLKDGLETQELMKELNAYSYSNNSYTRYSTNNIHDEEARIKMLYITPEKFSQSEWLKGLFTKLARANLLSRFIIDEAHCLSQVTVLVYIIIIVFGLNCVDCWLYALAFVWELQFLESFTRTRCFFSFSFKYVASFFGIVHIPAFSIYTNHYNFLNNFLFIFYHRWYLISFFERSGAMISDRTT